jgi:cold shock protein
MAQREGVVRWFNNAKGYGFLGCEGEKDVFVHYTAIQKEGYKGLKEGDRVTYDVIQGDKGLQADMVTVLRS